MGLWLALVLVQGGAEAEYRTRLAAFQREVAEERVRIAGWLCGRRLHEWARAEYEKALAGDPHNPVARDALGFRAEGDRWVSDPERGIPRTNSVAPSEWDREAARYWARLDALGCVAAEGYVDLARWCADQGMREAAAEQALAALAYDPACADGAAVLGWAPASLVRVPVDPRAREVLDRARTGVGDAPRGEERPSEEAWAVETVQPHMRLWRAPHVSAESTYMPADWLARLAQTGEHAFRLTNDLFGLAPEPPDQPHVMLAFVNDYEYEALIRWVYSGALEERWRPVLDYHPGVCLNARTTSLMRSIYQEPPLDHAAHHGGEYLVSVFFSPAGGRGDWLDEGTGLLAEWLVTAGAGGPCQQVGTGDAAGTGNYREVSARAASRLEDRPLPLMVENTSGRFGALHEPAKAASLLEWLACRYRDRLVAFVRGLLAGQDVAGVVRGQFGWTVPEFDEFWRRWARAAYGPGRDVTGSGGTEGYVPSRSWCACRFCRRADDSERIALPPQLGVVRVPAPADGSAPGREAILEALRASPAVRAAAPYRLRSPGRLTSEDVRIIRRGLPEGSSLEAESLEGMAFDAGVAETSPHRTIAAFLVEPDGRDAWGYFAPTEATLDRWRASAYASVLGEFRLHVVVPRRYHEAAVEAYAEILAEIYEELGRDRRPGVESVGPLVWPWEEGAP